MAYIKVSNLPETTQATENDVLPVVQSGATKKIKYSNLVDKNLLTAIADNTTITTTSDSAYTTLVLKQYSRIGTKLSIVNNKIKIGAGVNHIKVNAHSVITNQTTTATYQQLIIYKNETAVQRASARNTVNWDSNFDISPIVISVAENDLIFLREFNRIAGTTAMSSIFITVEVID